MPYINLIFPERILYRLTTCKDSGEAEEIVQASRDAGFMLVATKIIHKKNSYSVNIKV